MAGEQQGHMTQYTQVQHEENTENIHSGSSFSGVYFVMRWFSVLNRMLSVWLWVTGRLSESFQVILPVRTPDT